VKNIKKVSSNIQKKMSSQKSKSKTKNENDKMDDAKSEQKKNEWWQVLKDELYDSEKEWNDESPAKDIFYFADLYTGTQWLKRIVKYCEGNNKLWVWFWNRVAEKCFSMFSENDKKFCNQLLKLPMHSSMYDHLTYIFMEKEDETKKVQYLYDLLSCMFAHLKTIKKEQDQEENKQKTKLYLMEKLWHIQSSYNFAIQKVGVGMMLSDPVIRYLWCVCMEKSSDNRILAEARVSCEVMDDITTPERNECINPGIWYSLHPFKINQKEKTLKFQYRSKTVDQDDVVGLVFYDSKESEYICLFHQRIRWHHYKKFDFCEDESKCTKEQKQKVFNSMEQENLFRARRLLRFSPTRLPPFTKQIETIYRIAAVEQEDTFRFVSKEPEVMFPCIQYDISKNIFYIRINRDSLTLDDVEKKSYQTIRRILKSQFENIDEPKAEFVCVA
jgi:hypothetical protein